MTEPDKSPIRVEVTDAHEFYCFRVLLNPRSGQQIEIMLHARSLVDLIHQCSLALCQWQAETTSALIQKITGLSEEEARRAGIIG